MTDSKIIQDWVQAAASGDERAWNFLYQHYYTELYARALQLCHDTAAAKDMVQESFVLAYLKLSQLKEPALFGGWMKKILTHQCYRFKTTYCARREPARQFSITDSGLEHELEEKLDHLSTTSRLQAAIASLPQVLSSTLLLRYFTQHQSYQQIAEVLSIPVGTVRSRLNEAKLKLTARWKEAVNVDLQLIKESTEWNQFYQETFSGIHQQDQYKNRFIRHLQNDVQIIAGGAQNIGQANFENMIHSDRKVGSWLTPTAVTSCGNTSIVEVKHYNSPEHPGHCPHTSVMVLYRKQEKVQKMHIHTAWQ